MKLNRKNILLEQSTWTDLPQSDQQKYEGKNFLTVKNLFRNQTPPKDLRKFNNKLQSIDWDKSPNNPSSQQTTTPSTGLNKYEGKYNPNFTIKLKDGKLYGSGKISDKEFGDVELIPVSGNKFKATISGIDVEINFNESDGLITGGTATATILGFSNTTTFTKVSSTPPKPDEPKTEDKSVWSCITKFNTEYNQYDLIDGGNYKYEVIDLPQNGLETIFMYYKNYDAVWAYLKDKKPIMKGKWQCKGDKAYLITWSDGTVSKYGTKDSGKGDEPTPNTTIDENPCPNGYKEGCVSEEDILNKKKALKVCRKCDLVKKVQENPEIKARIFRLQQAAGQEQKTDNVFGPIMLAAIKEYQSSHGINPTGAVGEKTLSKINSYTNSKVEEPKVNNDEPGINQTNVKNEPKINQSEVKPTNKPQVNPIYRRSSRQVLRPDEEL